MAEARRFVCGNCDKTIEAWSDGNPYFIDDAGGAMFRAWISTPCERNMHLLLLC